MCAQALKSASIRIFSHNLLLGFSFATPLIIIINAAGCVWERPNKTAYWSGWLLQMLILDATKKHKLSQNRKHESHIQHGQVQNNWLWPSVVEVMSTKHSPTSPLHPDNFIARWQPCLQCSGPGVKTLVNGHNVFRRHQCFFFPSVSTFFYVYCSRKRKTDI